MSLTRGYHYLCVLAKQLLWAPGNPSCLLRQGLIDMELKHLTQGSGHLQHEVRQSLLAYALQLPWEMSALLRKHLTSQVSKAGLAHGCPLCTSQSRSPLAAQPLLELKALYRARHQHSILG